MLTRGTERPAPAPPWVLAIVGAESTGKSTLAAALAVQLARATGWRCTWVPEFLRTWCEQHGRTPAVDEQQAIFDTQGAHIDSAAARHDIVICDTTPLMTAVYHQLVFNDRSLEDAGITWHRRNCHLTLLTALDLPWQADAHLRDGPHVREPVDTALRRHLMGHGVPFVVVSGTGQARVEAAVDAVAPLLRGAPAPSPGLFSRLAARDAAQPAWRWACDNCDVPDCEHAARRRRRGE